jgi:hypothetical protein
MIGNNRSRVSSWTNPSIETYDLPFEWRALLLSVSDGRSVEHVKSRTPGRSGLTTCVLSTESRAVVRVRTSMLSVDTNP